MIEKETALIRTYYEEMRILSSKKFFKKQFREEQKQKEEVAYDQERVHPAMYRTSIGSSSETD